MKHRNKLAKLAGRLKHYEELTKKSPSSTFSQEQKNSLQNKPGAIK